MTFPPPPRKKKGHEFQSEESPYPIPIQSLMGKPASDTRWFYYSAKLIGNAVIVDSEGDMHFLYKMGFFGKGNLSRSKPEFALFASSYQGTHRKNLPAQERRFQQSRFQKVRQQKYERHLSWKKQHLQQIEEQEECSSGLEDEVGETVGERLVFPEDDEIRTGKEGTKRKAGVDDIEEDKERHERGIKIRKVLGDLEMNLAESDQDVKRLGGVETEELKEGVRTREDTDKDVPECTHHAGPYGIFLNEQTPDRLIEEAPVIEKSLKVGTKDEAVFRGSGEDFSSSVFEGKLAEGETPVFGTEKEEVVECGPDEKGSSEKGNISNVEGFAKFEKMGLREQSQKEQKEGESTEKKKDSWGEGKWDVVEGGWDVESAPLEKRDLSGLEHVVPDREVAGRSPERESTSEGIENIINQSSKYAKDIQKAEMPEVREEKKPKKSGSSILDVTKGYNIDPSDFPQIASMLLRTSREEVKSQLSELLSRKPDGDSSVSEKPKVKFRLLPKVCSSDTATTSDSARWWYGTEQDRKGRSLIIRPWMMDERSWIMYKTRIAEGGSEGTRRESSHVPSRTVTVQPVNLKAIVQQTRDKSSAVEEGLREESQDLSAANLPKPVSKTPSLFITPKKSSLAGQKSKQLKVKSQKKITFQDVIQSGTVDTVMSSGKDADVRDEGVMQATAKNQDDNISEEQDKQQIEAGSIPALQDSPSGSSPEGDFIPSQQLASSQIVSKEEETTAMTGRAVGISQVLPGGQRHLSSPKKGAEKGKVAKGKANKEVDRPTMEEAKNVSVHPTLIQGSDGKKSNLNPSRFELPQSESVDSELSPGVQKEDKDIVETDADVESEDATVEEGRAVVSHVSIGKGEAHGSKHDVTTRDDGGYMNDVDSDPDRNQLMKQRKTLPRQTPPEHDDGLQKEETEAPTRPRKRHPVKNPDPYPIQEFLQLSLEEAFFLSYGLGCLSIVKENSVEPLGLTQLWIEFQLLKPRFPATYAAYHYYRSQGWVPRSGLKYGCDFVVYRKGPSFYHSSLAVLVEMVHVDSEGNQSFPRNLSTWSNFTGFSRIVENAAKGVLYLESGLQGALCDAYQYDFVKKTIKDSFFSISSSTYAYVMMKYCTHFVIGYIKLKKWI